MITTLLFIIYTLIFILLFVFGVLIQQRKENVIMNQTPCNVLNNISLLVPFRNEEHRIHTILASLNAAKGLPKRIIFINDHSEDSSLDVIQKSEIATQLTVINLPNGVEGKKQALRFAMELYPSEYYLTMDADVYFEPDYFIHLTTLPKVDLVILPVVLEARNFSQRFFELDVLLINAINQGIAGFTKPIVASGANLLFKSSVLKATDSILEHQHISSGDDMFLLADFKRANASIQLVTSMKYAVYTETPNSLQAFLKQRLRWISKTSSVKDGSANCVALFQGLFTTLFVVGISYELATSNWSNLSYLVFLKTVIDGLFIAPFFYKQGRLKTLLLHPFYEVLFPIYSIFLLYLSFTRSIDWKGRKITKS
jgi:cellulose synthase/poly-beta-1,6-N-acetylglucosamine synthase-like glycosyltransferase